jgi:hypothetical protein
VDFGGLTSRETPGLASEASGSARGSLVGDGLLDSVLRLHGPTLQTRNPRLSLSAGLKELLSFA